MDSGELDEGREARFQALAEAFIERIRRGERPSLAEYTAKAPDLAERIQACFPAMVLLEGRLDALDPLQLGEFKVVRELGRGGMGIVYEAEQPSLHRRVALKVLPRHVLNDKRKRERFLREARTAAQLRHPNIVPVHGVGEERGTHYYVQQLIEGQSLQAILAEVALLRRGGDPSQLPREPPLPASTTAMAMALSPSGEFRRDYYRSIARVGREVAQAIAHAHGAGILHRDIKPSNVLLDTSGQAWVADFGLAKALDSGDLTRSDEVVGTLRYLAPERLRGVTDERSDIYSLGVTLYEALTLRPAFDSSDRESFLGHLLHDEPPAPRTIDPGIPRDLERVVLQAMAKRPGDRYASASELAADLDRVLEGSKVRARWLSPRRMLRYLAAGPQRLLATTAIVLATGVLIYLQVLGAAPGRYPVGMGPNHVLAADVNGDGRLDLITANPYSNDVSVLANRGGGRFAWAASFKVMEAPRFAACADLDGDSDVDLVTADRRGHGLTVLLNDSRGKYAAGKELPLPDSPACVIAADLDGDGDMDLASVGGESSLWITANGAKGFVAPRGFPTLSEPNLLLAGDFDRDGDPDLVVTSSSRDAGRIVIHRNEGNGDFGEGATLPEAPQAYGIAAFDIDGDQDLDLAGTALAPDGRLTEDLWTSINDGAGRLGAPQTTPLGRILEALSAGDLDGDGDLDVVLAGGASDVMLLRNDGKGRFAVAAVLEAGQGPTSVTCRDLDGDGRLDIAVANGRSSDVSVLLAGNLDLAER